MGKRRMWILVTVLVLGLSWGAAQGIAAQRSRGRIVPQQTTSSLKAQAVHEVTNAQRRASAARLTKYRALKSSSPLNSALSALLKGNNPLAAMRAPSAVAATLTPNATPDYYNVANYANSPLPDLDASGNAIPGTGIRKFVDTLPGLGVGAANNLGQYLPVAVPDKTSFPGSDYYVIELGQYTEKLGSDIPATTLRGYRQTNTTDTAVSKFHYLGPLIIAQKDRPVRVKFVNKLPTGAGGNLFLPTDTTIMGAGMGPNGGDYSQNRATLHLHGGATPWISDGTPHQWTTPAGEVTTYPVGVSVKNVPDMWFNSSGNPVATGTAGASNSAGSGTITFYYTNQQSARLMFYHDHSYGLTRLNVYAGEAAGYLLQDPIEQKLVNGGTFKANGSTFTVSAGTIPAAQLPLVIQDKTFVPSVSQIASEDPTWDQAKWGGPGNLWLPHVYMPNQISGNDIFDNELFGVSAMGRWDYNPWFYPPIIPIPGIAGGGTFGTPIPNPYWGQVGQPKMVPGTPTPTIVPEAFMDTPLVNGTAYPVVQVSRKAYRFRILNACNDRSLNLQLYFAKSNGQMWGSNAASMTLVDGNAGEVPMVPASRTSTWPASWPTDGRDGGVPDPSAVGPSMIQIGTEGGFLPSATVLPNNPVGYEYFRRTITVLNVTSKTLFLGPAERADVIVDFSGVPNDSKLILYNDAPAPVPAFDARLDYYTGDVDQLSSGGAPTTQPGYGPNTRTVMQIQVTSSTPDATFSLPALSTGLKAAYAATQDKPIVPEAVYGPTFNSTFRNNYVHATDTSISFSPASHAATVTFSMNEKAIIEGFDPDFGRMNANLGGTLPNFGPAAGAATPFDYVDPPTDITTNTIPGTAIGALADGTQIWRIDHQGVDTHAIHFHLMNVQLINRIALDGQLFVPDANELGWKETIRMNPGQDVIIAMRPMVPKLPFKLGDSIRPLNPALPVGSTFVDQLGTTVTNSMTNFGWEYVWHCHLLGHEENDMMRPFVFEVSPEAPTTLTLIPSLGPIKLTLHWINRATSPAATNYYVQRATNAAFTTGVVTHTLAGTPSSYVDSAIVNGVHYYYRVRAETSVSFSEWTNVANAIAPTTPPLARTNLHFSAPATRGSLTVAWTNPVGGTPATSLRVQFSRTGSVGPWTTQGTLAATVTSRLMGGLIPNTNYWIRVQAVNAGGATNSAMITSRTLP